MDALPFVNTHDAMPDWWELAFVVVPIIIIIQQFRKKNGIIAGSIIAVSGILGWCFLWWVLTFFGGLVGNMAQHYEDAKNYDQQRSSTEYPDSYTTESY